MYLRRLLCLTMLMIASISSLNANDIVYLWKGSTNCIISLATNYGPTGVPGLTDSVVYLSNYGGCFDPIDVDVFYISQDNDSLWLESAFERSVHYHNPTSVIFHNHYIKKISLRGASVEFDQIVRAHSDIDKIYITNSINTEAAQKVTFRNEVYGPLDIAGSHAKLEVILEQLDLTTTHGRLMKDVALTNAKITTKSTDCFGHDANLILSYDSYLDMDNNYQSLKSISGSGTVDFGAGNVVPYLQVFDSSFFQGKITGIGSLYLPILYSSKIFELGSFGKLSDYPGDTYVGNYWTLKAGFTNTLSPNSVVTLNYNSTLDLNELDQKIPIFSSNHSSSNVKIGGAHLTLAYDVATTKEYKGKITSSASGTLELDGNATLKLTYPDGQSTHLGSTLITNGTLEVYVQGALGLNSAVQIKEGGTLEFSGDMPYYTDTVKSIDNEGTFNVNLGGNQIQITGTYNAPPLSQEGQQYKITDPILPVTHLEFIATSSPALEVIGDITLNGGTLEAVNKDAPPTTLYTLIQGNSLTGTFANFDYTPFNMENAPVVYYTPDSVVLSFAACNGTWKGTVETSDWGKDSNWVGGCVPGSGLHSTLYGDVATFDNGDPMSSINVQLYDPQGLGNNYTLGKLIFNPVNSVEYTISQYSGTGNITFDLPEVPGARASIEVIKGNHTLDVPLVLKDTDGAELKLNDGAKLTFDKNAQLTSLNDLAGTFYVMAGGSPSNYNGVLVNDSTNIKPKKMSIVGATVTNNQYGVITSTTLEINPDNPAKVFVNNYGKIEAKDITVGAGGTTTFNNYSTAYFTSDENHGTLKITADISGTTNVTNESGARFGTTGTGGVFSVEGMGTILIENRGNMGALDGAGNVTINNPMATLKNIDNGTFQAAQGGTLTVSNGQIYNDLTSTIGLSTSKIVFNGGALHNEGDIFASTYVQSGDAHLKLTVLSTAIFGNIKASDIANVGGILTVDIQSGNFSPDDEIDLITGIKGRLGFFSEEIILSQKDLLAQIIYTPNSVRLIFADPIGSTSVGSICEFLFASINQSNLRVQHKTHELHTKIKERKDRRNKRRLASEGSVTSRVPEKIDATNRAPFTTNRLESTIAQDNSVNVQRKEHQLGERVSEKEVNSSRFYIGPIGDVGSFKSMSASQTGFGFSSYGVYSGFDHAGKNFGLGCSADYENTKADTNHNKGKFDLYNLHGSLYLTYVRDSLPELAFDAIAGAGYQWLNIHRSGGSPSTRLDASGDTKGLEADVLFGAEYMFTNNKFQAMPENLMVTPFANLQCIWVDIQGFNEADAGIYAAKFEDQSARSMRSSIGARFEYLVKSDRLIFKPELDLAWQYEYSDGDRTLHFTTINLRDNQRVSRNISGTGRNTLLLGANFLFTIYEVFEMEISYDFQLNEMYQEQGFYLGVGGNF